jgi:DNA modification methylase
MKYKIEEIKNKIIQGDTLEELKKIPDESIDCIITSPPYWGLRDYGIEGQIGLESTLEEYLEKLLAITKELKRVLKKTGIMFWNHGDCYNSHSTGKGNVGGIEGKRKNKQDNVVRGKIRIDLPDKCLVLQNWRLILKMIDEQGWILRNVIIWHKPNHMPSSVKDRFTNSYEPVFMLVKNKKYYFDLDAARVPHKNPEQMLSYYQEPAQKQNKRFRRRETQFQIVPGQGYGKPVERAEKYASRLSFNYCVRDAEKKSKQCPQSKATKEEIKRYKQTHYPQDQAESFGSPRARYWREKKEKPYHPAGDPTIHGQRLPPQPNQEGAFHPLGKNPGDVWEVKSLKEKRPYACPKNLPSYMRIDASKSGQGTYPLGKNPGDLWRIPTQPAPPEVRGKFFAIFPEKLVEPMILAGCPAQVCKKCGKPRERIQQKIGEELSALNGRKGKPGEHFHQSNYIKARKAYKGAGFSRNINQTIGWTSCNCNAGFEPGIVLDPFMGSGTVAVVAKKLGRNFIGIELNPEYVKIANERLRNTPTPLL